MKTLTLELGSYSSGTMRSEDLIPVFLDALDPLQLEQADRQTIRAIQSRQRVGFLDDETADDDLSELFDLLNNYCPDYCYFGAHPGDGADYGVWVVDALLTDTHQGSYNGYVFRLPGDISPQAYTGEDGIDEPIDAHYTHALRVNDHGNATLYRRSGRRWSEVWSIV